MHALSEIITTVDKMRGTNKSLFYVLSSFKCSLLRCRFLCLIQNQDQSCCLKAFVLIRLFRSGLNIIFCFNEMPYIFLIKTIVL